MFRLNSVTKRYGEAVALQDLTLELDTGRTTLLIGPSGCGKSTILRLLVGLTAPESGGIEFDGARLDPVAVGEARRRLGYVIQEGGLFPHMTARRNVTLAAELRGMDEAALDARVGELCGLVRLDESMLERYPSQLSGGQRQRVSLMRALMPDPDALLLDEPLGALDPLVRAELQRDLRAIFRSLGKTVVMVSHDLAEAGFFADRIVLMRDGRIAQEGTLAELKDAPADDFVRDFVGAQRLIHEGGE